VIVEQPRRERRAEVVRNEVDMRKQVAKEAECKAGAMNAQWRAQLSATEAWVSKHVDSLQSFCKFRDLLVMCCIKT
jgi:hypothetical protein